MDSSNKKLGVNELSNEISRLSSENDQLRKMVGLMQENVELRFVLRDHETHVKSLSPPPPEQSQANNQQIADFLKNDASCSTDDKRNLHKSAHDNRSLHMGGLGIIGYKHRSKQVPMKGYDSSGSSSDSLTDYHAKEQRKFVSSVTKLHGHESGRKESSRSLQMERRMAHYK